MGFQPLRCFLETVPGKLLQHITSFATDPPPEVGVVGEGGSRCMVIYRVGPVLQTRFLLSTDPLCERRSFVRNLKQLAHFCNLGDGAILAQTLHTKLAPLAVL